MWYTHVWYSIAWYVVLGLDSVGVNSREHPPELENICVMLCVLNVLSNLMKGFAIATWLHTNGNVYHRDEKVSEWDVFAVMVKSHLLHNFFLMDRFVQFCS